MKCLEKEKRARPQRAAELLEMLDAIGTPTGTRAAARDSMARAWSGALAAIIPAAVYLVACGATMAGLRWLAAEGQVGPRIVVVTLIGALLGLPVVVGLGLLLHVRKSELRRA
jgi:hypothetical protein